MTEKVRPSQDAERVNAVMTALSNVRADHAAEQIMTANADSLTRDRNTNAGLDIALDNANLSAVLFAGADHLRDRRSTSSLWCGKRC